MTTVNKKKVTVMGMTQPKRRKNTMVEVVEAPRASNISSKRSDKSVVRFREKERFTSVSGSVTTQLTAYALNPGLIGTFPWLAGIAQSFDKYKIHSLTFRYKNIKGTQANGNIILSFDVDTLDTAGLYSAADLSKNSYYTDGAPWRQFELKIPGDGKEYFVRSSALAGVDLKTYDFGALFVCAEGTDDATSQGYVEVEYDIEFMYKQSSGAIAGLSAAQLAFVAGSVLSGSISALVINSATSFTLPAGTYILQIGVNPVSSWTGGGTITGYSSGAAGSIRMFKCTSAITLISTTSTDVVVMKI